MLDMKIRLLLKTIFADLYKGLCIFNWKET